MTLRVRVQIPTGLWAEKAPAVQGGLFLAAKEGRVLGPVTSINVKWPSALLILQLRLPRKGTKSGLSDARKRDCPSGCQHPCLGRATPTFLGRVQNQFGGRPPALANGDLPTGLKSEPPVSAGDGRGPTPDPVTIPTGAGYCRKRTLRYFAGC